MGQDKIYGLRDPRNGELRYIGVTNQSIRKRYVQHLHKRTSKEENNHRTKWIRELTSLGLSPVVCVFQVVRPGFRESAERFWIQYFRRMGMDLVNGTDGGDGIPNMSQEIKQKIGNANKGIKRTIEWRSQQSIIKKGHPPTYTKEQVTPLAREHCSNAKRGVKFSKEHCLNLSRAMREYWARKKSTESGG